MKNVEYPSNDKIVKMVKDYIDNSIYKYAILLDGEWGSGKTYFVENILLDKISKHIENSAKYKSIVYVSLYGIKNIQDVASKIYFAAIANNKKSKAISKASPIITGILKGTNINISVSDIGTSLSSFINISKYVLLIDDLERCNCDVSAVMGLLNNFVEHSSTKVIIIANEKEIEKNPKGLDSLECIAALNEKVYLKSKCDKNNNEIKKFSTEHLSAMTNEMFASESFYEKIKEKLIGQTIKYRPNLETIISEILTKNTTNNLELQQLLNSQIDFFVTQMKKKNVYNLRTFQFFLEKIIRIEEIIKRIFNHEYNNIMPKIVQYCFLISIKYKQGVYEWTWEDTVLYSSVSISDHYYSFEHIPSFAFVDYAVVFNAFDEEFIKETLISYFDYLEEKKANSKFSNDGSIALLSNWWQFSEKEVKTAIDDVCKKVMEKYYNIKDYPNIINALVYPISECDLEDTLFDKMFEFMIEEIRASDVEYSWRDYHRFYDSRTTLKKYNHIMEDIKSEIAKRKTNTTKMKIDLILEATNWGELLYKDMQERDKQSISERSVVSELDVDKIIENIKKSSNLEIDNFRCYISTLYDFSNIYEFFKKDIPNIKDLLTKLKKVDLKEYDKIKNMQVKMLIKLLESKLQDLENK